MASFVTFFPRFVDVDSPDWFARGPAAVEEAAPETLRSAHCACTSRPAMQSGFFELGSDDDAEPPTCRSDEIRATAPRAERNFDPADYVTVAPPRKAARRAA